MSTQSYIIMFDRLGENTKRTWSEVVFCLYGKRAEGQDGTFVLRITTYQWDLRNWHHIQKMEQEACWTL